MKKVRTLRPVAPPKQPHCGACLLTKSHLERYKDVYECSRVECPERRPVTAQAV